MNALIYSTYQSKTWFALKDEMENYALGVSHPLASCTLKKQCCRLGLKQQQEYCFEKSFRSSVVCCSTSRLNNELLPLPLPFYRKPNSRHHIHLQFKAAASSVPENANAESDSEKSIIRTVKLGAMFGTWYLLNISYNILNKQLLKVYPFPATITAFQLGCGTLLVFLMWTFNLHPKPNIRRSQFAAIFSLAALHTLGNLLTNISLGKVAVSFTHTIKSMEPFFTVLLSASLLGVRPSLWVVLSLVPIVGGVALASFTEASFNWIGFGTAMASNLTNQSRNVFSKKLLMLKEEDALDNINLFSVITIISFILLTPIAILMEGVRFTPSNLHYVVSQGFKTRDLWVRFLLAGFCFHSYQQVSYMILEMVSPVSHAVGNCVKRVVLIVSSVVFFQTPVSPINFIGTTIALAGVFLYSKMKRLKPKVA